MKIFIITIAVGLLLLVGLFVILSDKPSTPDNQPNATITDDRQIITITAKGGYSPQNTVARAGVPTILRFKTNGTFDCSSALRIASLDIDKNLPPSGTTDIDIGTPTAGTLEGNCSMGMFPFAVKFE